MSKCERCAWFEDCGCDEECEYYDPISPDEVDEALYEKYRNDLDERDEAYKAMVEEQNT